MARPNFLLNRAINTLIDRGDASESNAATTSWSCPRLRTRFGALAKAVAISYSPRVTLISLSSASHHTRFGVDSKIAHFEKFGCRQRGAAGALQQVADPQDKFLRVARLLKRLSTTSPRVNIVRAFEDGDFVFAHTEYDFARRNIGFEIFRFEDGRAVEHWDNIQARQGPNRSGRSMVDGPTESVDLDRTENNRALVRAFVENVLIAGACDRLADYVDTTHYAEHNPRLTDDVSTLRAALEVPEGSDRHIDYRHIHRVLAEGNFVLSVSEGRVGGAHAAFYDLFRVADGKLVEHWDTTEEIAPRDEWKNNNGKF
jgi:predicted SnoaL-like aldol condensation-catalyzing enzyme